MARVMAQGSASAMPATAAQGRPPRAETATAPARRFERPAGAVFSLIVHGLVVAVLISHSVSKGPHHLQAKRIVEISLDSLQPSSSQRAAAAPQPVPQPKADTVPPPDATAILKPRRMPPPPKPATSTAQQAKAPAKVAAPPKPNLVQTQEQKRGDEGESNSATILNRIRTNWLRPAASSATFHCKLRIDYQPGGFISNVTVLEGCGNNPLDDSVERAIWKTQPLPLEPSQAMASGSLVLDFTP